MNAQPRHAISRRRSKLSPLTVLGELLIFGGLVVVGYIVWQPWYTGVVVAGQQQQLSAGVSATFQAQKPDRSENNDEAKQGNGLVPVTSVAGRDEVFGVMYVPAFGKNYANVIAEGTERSVINVPAKGIGRYSSTQMPGEAGNFAVAAHRSGPLSTPFKEVMNLRLGDPIYIETAEGWYTYRFRSVEYVWPTEVEVLNPFPRLEGVPGEDQILTLTTCHPKDFGSAERAIAYAVFDTFEPTSSGPPAELLEVNSKVGKA